MSKSLFRITVTLLTTFTRLHAKCFTSYRVFCLNFQVTTVVQLKKRSWLIISSILEVVNSSDPKRSAFLFYIPHVALIPHQPHASYHTRRNYNYLCLLRGGSPTTPKITFSDLDEFNQKRRASLWDSCDHPGSRMIVGVVFLTC